MQPMCLRLNSTVLITIVLGGSIALVLIGQVDGNPSFKQYTFRPSGIDENGFIRRNVLHATNRYFTAATEFNWFPDEPLEAPPSDAPSPEDDNPEEPPGESPHEPNYGDDYEDEPPDDDSYGELLFRPPHDYRYRCYKGKPLIDEYMKPTCYSFDNASCSQCEDGAVLLCCVNFGSQITTMDASIETINVKMLNCIDNAQFQNISARSVLIEEVATTVEQGAFIGSQNIEILQIKHSKLGHMKRMDLIFEGLEDLRALYLDYNSIVEWDTKSTTNSMEPLRVLPSLEILTLRNNLFETLRNDFFEWLQGSPLKYLSLEGCNKIKAVDPGLLLPVSDSLQYLELAFTGMGETNLNDILSSNLTVIRGLGLKFLALEKIPKTALNLVNGSLEMLSLAYNNLGCLSGKCDEAPPPPPVRDGEEMEQDIFPYMPKLRELSLANCEITKFPWNTLYNLENLRYLFLHKNYFTFLPGGTFSHSNSLKYLNMMALPRDKPGDNVVQANFSGLNELEVLDASFSKLYLHESVLCNLPNLKVLLLEKSNAYFDESQVSKCLRNLEVLDISENKYLCENFNKLLSESLNIKNLRLSGCGLHQEGNFSILREMKSLEVLYLEDNEFSNVINLQFLKSMEKLKTLNLNKNGLVSWDTNILCNNTNLQHLFIGSNEVSSISQGMMKYFVTLRTLDASNNPYLCYCSISPFRQFADILSKRENDCDISCATSHRRQSLAYFLCLEQCKKNSKYNNELQKVLDGLDYNYKAEDVQLKIIGWKHEEYRCLEKSGRGYISNFNFENWQCFTDVESNSTRQEQEIMDTWKMAAIVVGSITFLMIITVGVCFWKWKYIYQFGKAVRSVTLLNMLDDVEEPEDHKKVPFRSPYAYDVFISYSDPNRQWVLDELVPNFENNSELRVCLHERDFQVGLSILENIISCMDQSRSILLVISQAFLRSQWCQFELHLAQHRLLETRREDLILVLLEEIPTSRRPKMLRYLMLTKTYIQWPGCDAEAEALKLFWKRLRHAVMLPHSSDNKETSA